MKRILISLITLLALIGCEKKTAPPGSEAAVKVVATIGMIGDVAQNIGGERVEVYSMMGPGVDPHLYKAKAGDLQRLNSADLVLYNGIHLESKMGEVFEKLSQTRHIVAVGEVIPEERLLTTEGAHDPHLWFDVTLWTEVSRAITDALIESDPEGTAIYKANFDNYLKKLSELETYVQEQAAIIPEDQRILITAHDAFGYFGSAYGFDVMGLQGISTVDEAGTSDIRQMADFIAEKKIKALFVETSVSPKSIQALQAAVQDRGWQVTIGGELFSDAMGDWGTAEGTYLGMVTHNIDTIVAGLTGGTH